MIIWCEYDGAKFLDTLVCIYTCPKHRKLKCKAYAKMYPQIKVQGILQKYIDKYGEPKFDIPFELRPKVVKETTRKKRRTKEEMLVFKELQKNKHKVKPKTKKVKVKPIEEVLVRPEDTPKRKRRTKAEMEASRCL